MFNGNNLPHELLLTTWQTTKLKNGIENNMATDIKLGKAQISKIIQPGGFLSKLLGPLLKTRLPLLKSVMKFLRLLGLAAASSAIDAGVHNKKILGSGCLSDSASQTTLTTQLRHFRSIFITKFINRKRNCTSWRRNCKSRRRNLKKEKL